MQYREHIEELCDEHDIFIFWHRGRDFHQRDGEIHIPLRLDTCTAYYIALHEIGHEIFKHKRYKSGPKRTPRHEVHEQEIEAWGWARANARYPMDAEAEAKMLRALRNYRVPEHRLAAAGLTPPC